MAEYFVLDLMFLTFPSALHPAECDLCLVDLPGTFTLRSCVELKVAFRC